jgi:hypothetical protein
MPTETKEVTQILPLNTLNEDQYGPAGAYDVINDYDWTLSPRDARGDKVPSMTLVEYEMDSNALIANLKYWVRPIFDQSSNPYKGLYRANPTGVSYTFPWFEEYNHAITQNWEDFKGLEATSVADKFVKGLSLLTNSPGIAINTPKVWKAAGRATVPYKITLFNTTQNPNASIAKNKKLINRLIAATLHDQQGPILAVPPALFTLDIPGVRYCPACVLANLEINNKGTIVRKNGIAIPEAYEVKFSINELIVESRQIYSGVTGGDKISAIINSEETPQEEESAEETPQPSVSPQGLGSGIALV